MIFRPLTLSVYAMLQSFMLSLLTFVIVNPIVSQILYSEHFNTLSLNTGTYTANGSVQTYLYSEVTGSLTSINHGNLIADTLSGNYPFRANGQKQTAWLTYKAANVPDTFAVSTSWLSPIGVANAWLITPVIHQITANSVLRWEALAPDVSNADGYEVYVSTNTGSTPLVSDFTNIIYSTSAESNAWQVHGLSLSSFANQSIRIAFKNNSNNKYQLWLDDIEVKNIPNSHDVETLSYDTYKYSTSNTNNVIIGTFKNNGSALINRLTVNYKVGNNPTITETHNLATPLSYLDTKQLRFVTPFTSSIADYYPVKIWVSAVNDITDQQASNDTMAGAIILSTAIPNKKVLVETYTGTSYGWAPDAFVALTSIAATNTRVIAASIHDNDQMASANGSVLVNDYIRTIPAATIDQYYFTSSKKIAIDNKDWNTFIEQRQAMVVPATVSVTNVSYNTATKELNATVSAEFFGNVKGDYRLNLYVKENNVYGDMHDISDNGWNQYSFSHHIPSSPYYQLGNYLTASTYLLNANEFKHQYVISEWMDGAYGAASIIPANSLTSGQTYSKAYTYTLNAPSGNAFRYNADNIYLIGVLSEYHPNATQRAVLNAAEVKLTTNPEISVGLKELPRVSLDLNLFPNPASDNCYLNYTLPETGQVSIYVYNALGDLVYIEALNAKAGTMQHSLNINSLPQGFYNVVVSFKQRSISKKLTIIH